MYDDTSSPDALGSNYGKGKTWFAASIANARAKAKKKYPGTSSFLQEIETAKSFSGEFRKEGRKRAIGWISNLLGIKGGV